MASRCSPIGQNFSEKTPEEILAEERLNSTVYINDLNRVVYEAENDMRKTVLGKTKTPSNLQDFSYVPLQIRRLRELPDNWDGRGAPRLPIRLISKAEEIWDAVVEIAPATLLPDVLPGGSEFITFSWRKSPGKNLQLSIFDNECGQLVLDWLIDTKTNGRQTNEADFDLSLVRQLVDQYLAD